jgi:hypothetical protein
MFLPIERASGQRRERASKVASKNSKRLRIEGLETRSMLSGVVNVEIAPLISAGNLILAGDGSNNNVQITQTTLPGQYTISSPSGESGESTLFQINGAGVTMSSVTVNGINGNIMVDLGTGNTAFTFNGTGSASGTSNVPAGLSIIDENGSHTNTLQNLYVNDDLLVERAIGSNGYAALVMQSSTVVGDTHVVNNIGGAGGDSLTSIDNSTLEGDSAGPAFELDNGNGFNTTTVTGNSQFGVGSFIAGSQPIVLIANGNGGSQTTFTGASAVAGPGTTTVYGGLEVENGTALPMQPQIVTFNSVNVLGTTLIKNANSYTTTIVQNSTLGSQLIDNPPGAGGPLEVENSVGFDSFSMTQSTLPWGLFIDNNQTESDNFGSLTQINQSTVGANLVGGVNDDSDLPPGAAFVLVGDNGADVVNLNGSMFAAGVTLSLLDGANRVTITNGSTMHSLAIQTGSGQDNVQIANSTISVAITISLGSGGDTMDFENENFATQLPSLLLGSIDIDGDGGVDTLISSSAHGDTGSLVDAIDFEIEL